MPNDDELLRQRIERGDRRALAEMISRVEAGEAPPPPPRPLVASTHSRLRRPLVVGVTGSGGAGKSTLIGALVGHLRSRDIRVGVLASDPQSPLSGGALLGDRIRVPLDPADEGVFFRSLSTRGAQGGISASTADAVAWLLAFGCDVVLVETVGTGQDQLAARSVVDRLVLLVTPASGDEVQWEKAGLIEVADLIAVNKSDLPGADLVRSQLVSSLALLPGSRPPPVLGVTATSGAGVPELWEAIVADEISG